jgi:hypothetical protein
LIAKETIKSYFMVHSAFVPGVAETYDELLAERGQDIVRLPFSPAPHLPPQVCLRDVAQVLRARGAIPIAFELVDGIVLAPPADRPFDTARVTGLYCVAESSPSSSPPSSSSSPASS